MTPDRVIAYIDGFNLYYGLRDSKLRSSRWLDIPAVRESISGLASISIWCATSPPASVVTEKPPDVKRCSSMRCRPADVAFLVSADSDLTAAVSYLRRGFPDKRVVVAFPPKRHSKELRAAADAAQSEQQTTTLP